jgi:1-acyl-sn-glycerol-3-phosphate acyltransferase
LTKRLVRAFLIGLFRFLFRLLTRLTVIGKQNLPEQGGYILASNHLSVVEVPLVYILIDRRDVTGFVAKDHQKNPLFRAMVNGMGGIWLNRDEADTRALRAARDHLKNGGIFGIAPEGTRSPTGALIQGKTGVAYLAHLVDVPIVPVAVTGTWKSLRKIFTLQRPPITVRFGAPFTLPHIERQDRDQALERDTDEIMSRIAALLPPEYRGVYADHPRLIELLATQGSA